MLSLRLWVPCMKNKWCPGHPGRACITENKSPPVLPTGKRWLYTKMWRGEDVEGMQNWREQRGRCSMLADGGKMNVGKKPPMLPTENSTCSILFISYIGCQEKIELCFRPRSHLGNVKFDSQNFSSWWMHDLSRDAVSPSLFNDVQGETERLCAKASCTFFLGGAHFSPWGIRLAVKKSYWLATGICSLGDLRWRETCKKWRRCELILPCYVKT